MNTLLKTALIFFLALLLGLSALLIFIPGVSVPWGQLLGAETSRETVQSELQTAPGYRLDLYSDSMPNARFMAVTRSGDLLVSQPKLGQVSLLKADRNGDGAADSQRVLIGKLHRPHGLALYEDWLYIAESDGVGRVPFDHSDGRLAGGYQKILSGLGDQGNHWTKSIGVGADGWIYLSSGSSCNVCEESDPQRATIMRFKPDGTDLQIFATGLRNSVGFDWSPKDGALYATDNGRDWLGDDFPPCELNRVEKDAFYGWPYANGDRVPDPHFSKGGEGKDGEGGVGADAEIQTRIANSRPPVHNFPAHNAPLGIQFLRSPAQSPEYRDAALVALHGSWNRTSKDGYKVVSLHWDGQGRIQQRDFLWGFLDREKDQVHGRPVAVAEDAQGNIYISDDYASAIYRVQPGRGESRPLAKEKRPHTAPHKPPAIDAGAARQGATVYQRRGCAQCHAEQLPLKGLVGKYTLQTLADYFDTPTPPMPNYGFSTAQKRALAHYLMERELQSTSTN